MPKLTADETVLGLAAAVTTRACELITDGWTKGKMRGGAGGVENFCIHGAVELAMHEVFATRNLKQLVQRDVEDVAVAFICDEAFGSMKGHSGGIPAAQFNDAGKRRHEEVTGVMERASERLWGLAVPSDETSTEAFTYSKWADVDEEQAKQYLYASLN